MSATTITLTPAMKDALRVVLPRVIDELVYDNPSRNVPDLDDRTVFALGVLAGLLGVPDEIDEQPLSTTTHPS